MVSVVLLLNQKLLAVKLHQHIQIILELQLNVFLTKINYSLLITLLTFFFVWSGIGFIVPVLLENQTMLANYWYSPLMAVVKDKHSKAF